jgi:hypothetical protein
VRVANLFEFGALGRIDLEANAAAQKGWWKFTLGVGRHDDEGELCALDAAFGDDDLVAEVVGDFGILNTEAAKLGNFVFAFFDNVEQVVGKVEVGFVVLVD